MHFNQRTHEFFLPAAPRSRASGERVGLGECCQQLQCAEITDSRGDEFDRRVIQTLRRVATSDNNK